MRKYPNLQLNSMSYNKRRRLNGGFCESDESDIEIDDEYLETNSISAASPPRYQPSISERPIGVTASTSTPNNVLKQSSLKHAPGEEQDLSIQYWAQGTT